MIETLNISIGKVYSANQILSEIEKFPGQRIQIGHALVNKKHKYYLGKKELGNLKNVDIKVLSIINPCEQNFAFKLIMNEETQKNLKEIEKNPILCYMFDMNDLVNAGYMFKGMHNAVTCINCVFKRKNMPFKASPYSEGVRDKKYYVKISFKGNSVLENIICEEE